MTKTHLDIAAMRAGATQATSVLRVLSNPDRLMLLCRISSEEVCVSDLEEELEIHQPTLSQQLAVLRSEALVTTRRDGKNIFYSIADPNVMTLLKTLYQLYCPVQEN